MNYLKYIEHSAENLQFFLWYRSYVERFSLLPESEKVLSPEWTLSQAEAEAAAATAKGRKQLNPDVAQVFKGTDFEKRAPNTIVAEFSDRASTPSTSDEKRDFDSAYGTSFAESRTMTDSSTYAVKADEAFQDVGLQWTPCECYRTYTYTVMLIPISHRSAFPSRNQPHHCHLLRR